MKWFIISFLLSFSAYGKLKVVTTTPNLAWLVRKLGGDRVQVVSLLDGTEDPHYVDAMPHWIAKVSQVDVFCMVGLELEVGWVPKVLSRSGNAKVQPGGKGHCDASKNVKALEVPSGKVDRSMGDVHADGNPHYQLGPTSFLQAAESIFEVLVNVDEKGSSAYAGNLLKLEKEIGSIKQKVARILKNTQDKKFMSYHKEFSYFFHEFHIKSAGHIEETPGVPPSAGRIARVSLSAKRNQVSVVLASTTNPHKILARFQEISGIPVAVVPVSLRVNGAPASYEELLVGVARALVKESH